MKTCLHCGAAAFDRQKVCVCKNDFPRLSLDVSRDHMPIHLSAASVAAMIVPPLVIFLCYHTGEPGGYFRRHLAFPGMVLAIALWFGIFCFQIYRNASQSVVQIVAGVLLGLLSLALLFIAASSVVVSILFPEGLRFGP